MVFCGKPSKACYECRIRRIKVSLGDLRPCLSQSLTSSQCDQKIPECTQCLRINKSWSGYRDPQAVTIRDESQNVARKASARLEREKEATDKREYGKATSSSDEALSLDMLKYSEGGNDSTLNVTIDAFLPYATFPVSVDDQGFYFLFS